jgi:type I restriction enzyme M protein
MKQIEIADFPSWLTATRKQRKLSQAELAQRLGVSAAQVSLWEGGKGKPKPEQLSLVERELGAVPGARKANDKPTKRGKAKASKADEPTGGAPEPNGMSAILGFEKKLWEAADKLRGSMDSAEYKHVVLGLIFLKYISDAFEHKRGELAQVADADVEDRDEYLAANVFWVPAQARWDFLRGKARQPDIGVLIDKAMDAIEKENPTLKGTLPKEYARPQLDKTRLGELLDLLSDVGLIDPKHSTRDVLGRVYEYFLGRFASQEGRGGGEFYTPSSVVRVLVDMIEPYQGRVYDPCCGSGGMFVQSEKFVAAHGGNPNNISVFGQEWNATTWRLCRMNLAIRGIEADLGKQWGDTFSQDQHKGLQADFILANPPFNISDWGGEHLREDARWSGYRAPPPANANYAWLLHIVHHMRSNAVAGVVLANGSMSSQQSGEGEIRQKMVENDLVDCMVALPGQLFYSTQIPACLWFLARSKSGKGFRDRKGELLFIDARKLGTLVDRTHRELSDAEIERIARAYHAWRGEKNAGRYVDIPGFCKSATLDEVRAHNFVLTPGRYVGADEVVDDEEPFEEKMPRLVAKLKEQFGESARLEQVILRNLKELGYG